MAPQPAASCRRDSRWLVPPSRPRAPLPSPHSKARGFRKRGQPPSHPSDHARHDTRAHGVLRPHSKARGFRKRGQPPPYHSDHRNTRRPSSSTACSRTSSCSTTRASGRSRTTRGRGRATCRPCGRRRCSRASCRRTRASARPAAARCVSDDHATPRLRSRLTQPCHATASLAPHASNHATPQQLRSRHMHPTTHRPATAHHTQYRTCALTPCAPRVPAPLSSRRSLVPPPPPPQLLEYAGERQAFFVEYYASYTCVSPLPTHLHPPGATTPPCRRSLTPPSLSTPARCRCWLLVLGVPGLLSSITTRCLNTWLVVDGDATNNGDAEDGSSGASNGGGAGGDGGGGETRYKALTLLWSLLTMLWAFGLRKSWERRQTMLAYRCFHPNPSLQARLQPLQVLMHPSSPLPSPTVMQVARPQRRRRRRRRRATAVQGHARRRRGDGRVRRPRLGERPLSQVCGGWAGTVRVAVSV